MSNEPTDGVLMPTEPGADTVAEPAAEAPVPSSATQASVRTVSGEQVDLTQCAAVSVTGNAVTATDSAIVAVMAGEVTANDSMIVFGNIGSLSGDAHVLVDLKAAVAGAVVFALTLLTLGRLLRRGS